MGNKLGWNLLKQMGNESKNTVHGVYGIRINYNIGMEQIEEEAGSGLGSKFSKYV